MPPVLHGDWRPTIGHERSCVCLYIYIVYVYIYICICLLYIMYTTNALPDFPGVPAARIIRDPL